MPSQFAKEIEPLAWIGKAVVLYKLLLFAQEERIMLINGVHELFSFVIPIIRSWRQFLQKCFNCNKYLHTSILKFLLRLFIFESSPNA